jgi:hypothetical protein
LLIVSSSFCRHSPWTCLGGTCSCLVSYTGDSRERRLTRSLYYQLQASLLRKKRTLRDQTNSVAHTNHYCPLTQTLHQLLPTFFVFTSRDTCSQVLRVDQMGMGSSKWLALLGWLRGMGRVASPCRYRSGPFRTTSDSLRRHSDGASRSGHGCTREKPLDRTP